MVKQERRVRWQVDRTCDPPPDDDEGEAELSLNAAPQRPRS
jgi:hypothetical protein